MATALWYIKDKPGASHLRIKAHRAMLRTIDRYKYNRKGINRMATNVNPAPSADGATQDNKPATKTVQRTVFDLQSFDDVKLKKEVPVPVKPTTLDEALAAVGNDKSKLLDVIYEGLVGQAMDAAYNDIAGFRVIGEDGELGQEYAGSYADDSKTKLINAAVLAFAKMSSGGSWDTLSKDKKRELKDSAIAFMRANPAILASIQK